jgi:hypothetical protein
MDTMCKRIRLFPLCCVVEIAIYKRKYTLVDRVVDNATLLLSLGIKNSRGVPPGKVTGQQVLAKG